MTELVAAFVRALQPDLCVETGTSTGQTTEAIGMALQANGQGKLVSLEINPQSVMRAAIHQLVAATQDDVLALAELPATVRGYEGIQLRNAELYQEQTAKLMSKIQSDEK